MSKKKSIKGVTCKNGYWYARVKGEQVYCGKGDKGRKLAEAAKSKDIVRRYENKEINAGVKVKRVQFKRVQDLANWYMTLPAVQEKKSYNRSVIAVGHLLKYFGKKPLSGVDADEQERYREHRTGQGAADATINLEISMLSAIFKLALKRKKILAEMMPGEFIRKGESVPRRIITEGEFEGLLKYSDTDFHDFMLCAYETAMRLSEIIKLTPGQIHLDIQHISGVIVDYIDLGIFDTKTGARRTVPVSPRLKEVLQARIQGLDTEDYIFTTSRGYKIHSNNIPRSMRAVCEKAGILYGDNVFNKKGERIGIVFHCFRHTRTTRWVEAGFSDEIIRRATGHKSLEAYQQYIKLDPAAVMRLVDDKKSKQDKTGTKSAQSLLK